MTTSPPRRSPYVWLCLSASAVVLVGFWFTYFGPLLAGEYPSGSPTVHVHGWTFFLWFTLLPLQAGLIRFRRVALHRTLGKLSVVLAVAMVATGMVVIGTQMRLAAEPDGSPFWQTLGPGVFMTLVLFVVFYVLAYRHRTQRELHKRYMLLASTGALGAAAFRVLGRLIGFGPMAGYLGILAPNLIILAAILIELRRGEGVHKVFRWGLPASIAAEAAGLFLTPTPIGRAVSGMLAWMGGVLAPLY